MHTWALDMYLLVITTTNGILILAELYVLYKAMVGTRYKFIIFLIILLILSNLGGILSSIYIHDAA